MDLIGLVIVLVVVLPAAAIVGGVLRSARRGGPAPPTGKVAPDDANLELAVRGLLRGPRPNKIVAIKVVRERTGLGLREAKGYVGEVEARLRARGGGQGQGTGYAGRSYVEMSEIVRAVRDGGGGKIEAIRRVRQATGLGLKEAKDLVDRLWP